MSNRIERKSAMPLAEVLKQMIQEGHASATHNTHRVFAAWDAASGAGKYTIRRYFRDGRLYITLSSSVICSQLSMQKDLLKEKINAILAEDELLIRSGDKYCEVSQLILK